MICLAFAVTFFVIPTTCGIAVMFATAHLSRECPNCGAKLPEKKP